MSYLRPCAFRAAHDLNHATREPVLFMLSANDRVGVAASFDEGRTMRFLFLRGERLEPLTHASLPILLPVPFADPLSEHRVPRFVRPRIRHRFPWRLGLTLVETISRLARANQIRRNVLDLTGRVLTLGADAAAVRSVLRVFQMMGLAVSASNASLSTSMSCHVRVGRAGTRINAMGCPHGHNAAALRSVYPANPVAAPAADSWPARGSGRRGTRSPRGRHQFRAG